MNWLTSAKKRLKNRKADEIHVDSGKAHNEKSRSNVRIGSHQPTIKRSQLSSNRVTESIPAINNYNQRHQDLISKPLKVVDPFEELDITPEKDMELPADSSVIYFK